MSVHVFFLIPCTISFSVHTIFAVSPSGSTPIESVFIVTIFLVDIVLLQQIGAISIDSEHCLYARAIAWSFAGFIIYIFLLTHNNIKHHHQHETYGEADGAEIAVLAA